jgi:hypothetical protein
MRKKGSGKSEKKCDKRSKTFERMCRVSKGTIDTHFVPK